ncbi:hypothetical protein [Comamonas aquatica]|uniref:hypothetical protein n=2 Tax=Comamonas aquatica TaxID=225991 RepID=UPI0024496748|nr:hypothetical protein [Comamonas aquatica]MDH0199793.1 hypothetical protein [Comamonas aquatica]MDH1447184.1 hypothetical protein [Comamonas aquatica]
MDSKKAIELGAKVGQLQALMIAYATDGRTSDQPRAYRDQYSEVTLELEEAKYANPNPHKSLEVFYAFCKLQEMKTYASRRAYVEELYVGSRTIGCLKTSVRCCMAERYCKQFWQHGNPVPRSCHADQPSQERYDHTCHPFGIAATLGKLIKQANLDPDIERLVSQAYGAASNKAFVRHGGTVASGLTKAEAEFFLEFAATSSFASFSWESKKRKSHAARSAASQSKNNNQHQISR